jgi:hypothetical protein
MKILNKIFLAIVLCASFLTQNHPGTIGASRWVKNDKFVNVYHDYHNMVVLGHFDFIAERIFNQSERSRPLSILVENYCYGPHANFVRQIDVCSGLVARFLERFNDFIGTDFGNGVSVSTVEARVLPYLLEWCVCESKLLVQKRHSEKILGKDLYRQLFTALGRVKFSDIFQVANEKFEVYLNEETDSIDIFRRLHQEFLEKWEEFIDLAQSVLDGNILNTRILVPVRADLMTGDFDNILALIGSDLFVAYLLSPVLEANIIHGIETTEGDVAIFVGGQHALHVESFLREMGYEMLERVNNEQLNRLEAMLQGTEIDEMDEEQTLQEELGFVPVSYGVFNWML